MRMQYVAVVCESDTGKSVALYEQRADGILHRASHTCVKGTYLVLPGQIIEFEDEHDVAVAISELLPASSVRVTEISHKCWGVLMALS